MVAGTENIRDLIVALAYDGLLEGHQVGGKPAKTPSEHAPTLVPLPPPPPQVERGDTHLARGCRFVHSVPPQNRFRATIRPENSSPHGHEHPPTSDRRRCCREALVGSVVATDTASANADRDNGT